MGVWDPRSASPPAFRAFSPAYNADRLFSVPEASMSALSVAVAELRKVFGGELVEPGDATYEDVHRQSETLNN